MMKSATSERVAQTGRIVSLCPALSRVISSGRVFTSLTKRRSPATDAASIDEPPPSVSHPSTEAEDNHTVGAGSKQRFWP
eukprot:6192424-Pleurochrysis_carterae.AAC.4